MVTVIIAVVMCGCRGPTSASEATDGTSGGDGEADADSTGDTDGTSDGEGEGGADSTEEAGDSPWFDLPPSPWHCNPVTAPCPSGEKCTIVHEPMTDSKCVPVHDDPVELGEDCELLDGGLDNCPDHAVCFGGECVGLCDEESSLGCADGEECGWHNNTNYTAYCHTPCHPLDPRDCEADQSCLPGNAIGFECWSAGGNAADEVCALLGDCAGGLVCVPIGDENRCKPFCSLVDDGCNDPDVCVSWYEEPSLAPPGYGNLGVCLPP